MKLLFIPHVPNLGVVNRVYEFAKNSDSYYLYWEMENSTFKTKILSQLRSLRYKKENGMVQIPLLFKPENIAPKINTLFLNRLIERLQIDVVVNANALLFDIASIKVPVIYDLVDDHLEINPDIGLTQKRIEKIRKDIEASNGVVCVTEILERKVKKFHANTTTIENGVYVERFKKARSLKKELGLEGKKVFGFIGGIDEWTGIEEAVEEYLKIKDDTNAFLVVGGNNSTFYRNLVARYKDEILFAGKVPPQKVGDYFKTIDMGLIPFRLNDFTHNALPIKALEYALAGACVISTPLKALRAKNYPFVEFYDIREFAVAMQKGCRKVVFDFETTDWKWLTQQFLQFVEKSV
jgi:glycosyltransferase involved in cell wall biosynthesis